MNIELYFLVRVLTENPFPRMDRLYPINLSLSLIMLFIFHRDVFREFIRNCVPFAHPTDRNHVWFSMNI